jgi:hypothetical protein
MTRKHGQSPVEFIITIFAFFIIVVAIFTSNLTNTQPEAEKIKEQGSCLSAQGLATSLLKEPGVPANWNPSNLEIFGLTNGTSDQVLLTKWLDAQSMGFAGLHNKTFPESDWLLSYGIYGFKLFSESCPAASNGAVICRNLNSLNITANSNNTATMDLELFFPFATISYSGTLEPDDNVTVTPGPDGTLVEMILNTSAADTDQVFISLSATPDLVFIKKSDYTTTGQASLPVFLNDVKVSDSLGSGGAVSGLNNYCNYQQQVLIVKTGENLPARFDIIAW